MPGLFDQGTVDRIQQANNIVEVISEYVSLAKKGREMVGVCPFHDDHRPSMYVSEVKQIFKCFACGAGGDVFKFVQMQEQLTFPQAIERLAQRAGIHVQPIRATGAKKVTSGAEIDRSALTRLNDWARRYFAGNLFDPDKGRAALDYLASRQISVETAKAWHLGLALNRDTDLLEAAAKKGIERKLLQEAGLIASPSQDKFVNRLMFSITDVTGRVIGFGGRTLGDDRAKYVNSPTTVLFDKSQCLYGLEAARHAMVASQTAVLVEGYTDCLMAHQMDCRNVVATLGTSLTSGHGRILRRYAKTLIVIFDGDTAGMEAANRALDVCLRQRVDIKVATLPADMDPCDFLLAEGKVGFERLIDRAVDVFQFKWQRLNDRFQADNTLAGRKEAIEAFLQTIAASIHSGNLPVIERGLIVNRLSGLVGLPSHKIEADLTRRIRSLQNRPTVREHYQADIPVPSVEAAAQSEILEVLLNEPRLYEDIRGQITVDVFDDPILKEIAGTLFACLETNPLVTGTNVLARTEESGPVANRITELMQVGEQKGNYVARFQEAVDVLQQSRFATKSPVAAEKDSMGILQSTVERVRRRNRHSLGLIE